MIQLSIGKESPKLMRAQAELAKVQAELIKARAEIERLKHTLSTAVCDIRDIRIEHTMLHDRPGVELLVSNRAYKVAQRFDLYDLQRRSAVTGKEFVHHLAREMAHTFVTGMETDSGIRHWLVP